MPLTGNRREANPIIINPDNTTTKPTRIPFNEKSFPEGWIQDFGEKPIICLLE